MTSTLTETLTVGGRPQTVVYEPGQVRLAPTWSRNAVPGEDWPRTLAHELSHYALFLDDNYLGLDDSGALTTITTCPGAMSDPYSDLNSEFQLDGLAWKQGGGCARTLSARSTGRSDWATIQRFYSGLNAPPELNSYPGPSHLALALLQIQEVAPSAGTSTAHEVSLSLVQKNPQGVLVAYEASTVARAVLYQSDGQRATDLGTPTGDLLLVRGAHNGDTVCVYDASQGRVGCEGLTDFTSFVTMDAPTGWAPALLLTPVNSTTLRLEVAGVEASAGNTLQARIFPEAGEPQTVNLARSGDTYSQTVTLGTAALGGMVRGWATARQRRAHRARGSTP